MRFDIISVFPEFFRVLDLSLVGKAQKRGIMSVQAHDLRNWAHDVHRSVDDTPAGGGAGMVMRADIWGDAIDEVRAGFTGEGATILAIPTPSGVPLTQRMCEDVAGRAGHVIIACGRYEGIDARVAQHYTASGVDVLEYSLGDYVLNGGEVAAVALIEAVGRLLPGMVGNPESLREESHSEAGLLEYPVYTRPVSWRGLDIPEVLQSGNHGAARRWRRDRAIEKTALRRPDMIISLDNAALDKKDKRALLQAGYLVRGEHPEPFTLREAEIGDVERLARLSALTFPDACPRSLSDDDIARFIEENLSVERWREYLQEPQWQVVVCECGGDVLAYTLCLIPEDSGVAGADEGAPVDAVVDGVPREGALVELSKFYVLREWRSTGLAGLMWGKTRELLSEKLSEQPNPYVWLGTNENNRRAHKAYTKQGFIRVGKREFNVGDVVNSDSVFARRIHVA